MDKRLMDKIFSGRLIDTEPGKVQIGDILSTLDPVKLKGTLIIEENGIVKKIFSNGNSSNSGSVKSGAIIMNSEDFLNNFAEVVSFESKDNKSPIIFKFKSSKPVTVKRNLKVKIVK